MSTNMQEWMRIGRKYGTIFENVVLTEENNSFIVRTIDQEKEFLIEVPFPILLPEEYIEITEQKHQVREDVNIPSDLRMMLNSYLDFILSEERINGQEKLMKGFTEMPEVLRSELNGFFSSHLLDKNYSVKKLKEQLFRTRLINIGHNKKALIPFIDFIDHSLQKGERFKSKNRNTITLGGKATESGEVFAIYNSMIDSFGYLNTYHFVPQAENALSMMMTFRIDRQTVLVIGRKTQKFDRLMQPECRISKHMISLSGLWLGSNQKGSNPFHSFKKLWEEKLHRTDTLRIYSMIKNININKLVTIIKLCDSAEQSHAVQMVKECALQQLTLIEKGSQEIAEQ